MLIALKSVTPLENGLKNALSLNRQTCNFQAAPDQFYEIHCQQQVSEERFCVSL